MPIEEMHYTLPQYYSLDVMDESKGILKCRIGPVLDSVKLSNQTTEF